MKISGRHEDANEEEDGAQQDVDEEEIDKKRGHAPGNGREDGAGAGADGLGFGQERDELGIILPGLPERAGLIEFARWCRSRRGFRGPTRAARSNPPGRIPCRRLPER